MASSRETECEDSSVESRSGTDGEGRSSVHFDTEEELSVPSHNKTPLPKFRENPALQIQECMSNVSSPKYRGLLATSMSLSQRFSTERCQHYKDATDKVKLLMAHFSHIVEDTMPAHASEAFRKNQNTTAEVLLVKGIMAAGKENYEKAIKIFKEALISCSKAISVGSRQLRVSALHQIGISLCLMNDFSEAERYYQFALEECTKDQQLIANSVSKYSELAASTGEGSAGNLPIDTYLSNMHIIDSGDSKLSNNTNISYPSSPLPSQRIKSQRDKPLGPSQENDGQILQAKGEHVDQRQDLNWFPRSKEELLDYSAAYIQMMVMGAEMVNHQQEQRRYAGTAQVRRYSAGTAQVQRRHEPFNRETTEAQYLQR